MRNRADVEIGTTILFSKGKENNCNWRLCFTTHQLLSFDAEGVHLNAEP